MAINKNQHYKTIAKTCYTANITYLILRVIYLILFVVAEAYTLVIVDVIAIVIYLLFFLLLKKKKYYLYALCCGNEFFIFVSVITLMIGFSSGFPLYLIGLCVVSFFTSYFSKTKNIKGSVVWVGLSLAIFLTLYFVTKFSTPFYEIEAWLEMVLFTMHAILVFAFIAAYLVVFLRYALSLEKKIMSESRTDELTQISNRYGLYDYFEDEEDKSTLMLALFDIDDFKNINDVYGHVYGDFVLKKVADLTSSILSDAFVCRYGGEEFVIVLKETENEPLFDRLEKLRTSIEQETFESDGVKTKITVTIGGVYYQDDITLEKWVELADQRMYSGKNTGKNKTVI